LIFVFAVDKRSGISFIHIMGGLFVIEVGLMLLLGKLFPRATAYQPTVRAQGDMRYWKYAKSMSVILMALLLSVYLTFSPFGVASATGPSVYYYPALLAVWLLAFGLAYYWVERGEVLQTVQST
jgi:SSS family solute:Na+ symporter